MNFITSQAANSAQAAANLSPSTMSAQTVLAEDTIFGTVMDIKSGKGTTALFANPLNGDKEEMLYIDEANKICWIRHSNGQYSSPGSQEQPSWAVETVAEGYSSVVVAVQPDGTVWAFAIATATLNVSAFVLKSNATAAGGARWTPFTLSYPMGNAGTLEVRYQSDGSSSPLLVLARKDGVLEMFFPLPPQKDGTEFYSSWGFYGSLPNISSDDVKNYGCAGAKGAPDSKQTQVWLYTLDPNGKLMQITGMSGGGAQAQPNCPERHGNCRSLQYPLGNRLRGNVGEYQWRDVARLCVPCRHDRFLPEHATARPAA